MRLSEWSRQQGVSRITAYRMLKKGILPVASERSPTGRWYVLVPGRKENRIVLYARATPGPKQVDQINDQIAVLAEWAALRHRSVFTVVREIANPDSDPMPRLERLLYDQEITEIIVRDLSVIGEQQFRLLNAALASQGRVMTVVRGRGRRPDRD